MPSKLLIMGLGPAWSPDGKKIAFVSWRESNHDMNDDIYVMNADGTNAVNLTNHEAQDFDPAWSPDGTKIAFVSDRGGNYDIYVMNADGTGEVKITDNPGRDSDPTWSPGY